jgi:hypothetical protein
MNSDPALTRAQGRLVDRTLALVLATFILLTPPILKIFNVPVLVWGLPLLHIYCYGVWLLAIACGARLASRLGAGASREPAERS